MIILDAMLVDTTARRSEVNASISASLAN